MSRLGCRPGLRRGSLALSARSRGSSGMCFSNRGADGNITKDVNHIVEFVFQFAVFVPFLDLVEILILTFSACSEGLRNGGTDGNYIIIFHETG